MSQEPSRGRFSKAGAYPVTWATYPVIRVYITGRGVYQTSVLIQEVDIPPYIVDAYRASNLNPLYIWCKVNGHPLPVKARDSIKGNRRIIWEEE